MVSEWVLHIIIAQISVYDSLKTPKHHQLPDKTNHSDSLKIKPVSQAHIQD